MKIPVVSCIMEGDFLPALKLLRTEYMLSCGKDLVD